MGLRFIDKSWKRTTALLKFYALFTTLLCIWWSNGISKELVKSWKLSGVNGLLWSRQERNIVIIVCINLHFLVLRI